jgi:hypothetical protein
MVKRNQADSRWNRPDRTLRVLFSFLSLFLCLNGFLFDSRIGLLVPGGLAFFSHSLTSLR